MDTWDGVYQEGLGVGTVGRDELVSNEVMGSLIGT